jgi:chromosome segregation ATPase
MNIQNMKRAPHLALAGSLLLVTACATTGSADPRQDNGLFSTISGNSGKYKNYTTGQANELSDEQRRAAALRNSQEQLRQQANLTSAQVSALRAEVTALDDKIGDMQDKASALTASTAEKRAKIASLQNRLDDIRASMSGLKFQANKTTVKTGSKTEYEKLLKETQELEAVMESLI